MRIQKIYGLLEEDEENLVRASVDAAFFPARRHANTTKTASAFPIRTVAVGLRYCEPMAATKLSSCKFFSKSETATDF